jgi:hypothetical protein
MAKVYQPIVIERAENLLQGLIDSDFFDDNQITEFTYAREYLRDKMTEKYIQGLLNSDDENLFTEEEFNKMLVEILVGSVLCDLKNKGLVSSYEDDETDELFFLTDEGRDFLKKIGHSSNPD